MLRRSSVILIMTMLAAACGDATSSNRPFALTEGTVSTVRLLGQVYQTTAVEVDGLNAVWEWRWRDRVVSESKTYMGLFTTSVREQESSFLREFDTAPLDALFPLGVGAETTVSGIHYDRLENREYPFWAHFVVRGKDVIGLKEGDFDVFIVDITTDHETDTGTFRIAQVLWYAPDLGMALRSDSTIGDEVVSYRVLSVTPGAPNGPASRGRNAVGTTMI